MANLLSCYPLNFKHFMTYLSLIVAFALVIHFNPEESVENTVQKRKNKPNVFFLHPDNNKQAIEKKETTVNIKSKTNINTSLTKSYQVIGKIDVVNASSQTEGKCVPMLPILEVPRPNCNFVHEFDIFTDMSFNNESKIMGIGGKRIAWRVDYEHPVVLKTLRWDKNFTKNYDHTSMKDASSMEVVSFSHNIVHVYGYCASAVVNELGHMGADQYLKGRKISVKQKLQYSAESASGVADIHSIKVQNHSALVHADLRPWNFLLTDGGRHMKIHDFNEAKFMKWNDQTKKPCGFTQYWCNRQRSPEECTQGKLLDEKVDIYGLGNFLFFILTNQYPHKGFKKELSHQMVAKGIAPAFPQKIMKSKDPVIVLLRRVISKCHIADPKNRPTAREVADELVNAYAMLKNGKKYEINS